MMAEFLVIELAWGGGQVTCFGQTGAFILE
jgi:hypothetical protein